MTKELSAHQVCLLVFALYLGLGLVNLPSFYAKTVGIDCWLVYLWAQTIQLIIIFAAIAMYRHNPDLNLEDYLSRCVGRVVSKIMLGVLFLFFVFKLATSLGISFRFYSENIYERGNYILYGLLVLPFMFYAHAKGLRSVGRFAEITFIFSITAVVLLIVFGAISADFINVLPILKDGVATGLGGLRHFLSASGDALTVLVFASKIAKSKHFPLRLALSAAASIVVATLFILVFIACYGNTAQFLPNAPGHIGELPLEMLEIGKLEWILILMFYIFSYIKLCLFLYACCRTFAMLVGLKESNKLPGMIILPVCFVFPVFFPDFAALTVMIDGFAPLFLLPVIVLPLMVIISALLPKHADSTQKAKEETA